MYYSSSSSTLGKRNDVILKESELEEMRLRKIFEDNIRKVEKENWESIAHEIQNGQKLDENSESISKRKKAVLKTSDYKKVKCKETPSLHTTSLSSVTNKKPIKNENVCGQFEVTDQNIGREKSVVNFLNHFENLLKSSKIDLHKKLDSETKFSHCIPLAAPSQTHGPSYMEKLYKSKKLNTNISQRVSKENNKNMTIQSLPSISISGQNDQRQPNISIEIFKSDELECKNFKPLPLKPPNAPVNEKPLKSIEKSSELKINVQESLKKSIFIPSNVSQYNKNGISNNENHSVTNGCTDKETVKSIVKEVLNDYRILPSNQRLDLRKENGYPSSKVKNHAQPQTSKKEELHFPNQEEERDKRNIISGQNLNSSYSQTDSEMKNYYSSSLKDIVREVMSEYQVFFTSMLEISNKFHVNDNSVQIPKVNKEIQTHLSVPEHNIKDGKVFEETQISQQTFHRNTVASFSQNQSSEINLSTSQEPRISNSIVESTEISMDNKGIPHIDTAKQIADLSLKIENLTNVFNNHLLEKNNRITTDKIKDVQSSIKTTYTRDVSLQFSPYLITRSAHTSPTRTTEQANQCEFLIESASRNKSDAVAQTSLKDISDHCTVNQSTQCQPPMITTNDCETQTGELRPATQVSDHSNSTSMSSTPVSDSLFLDDVISEGEVPWHLQLQSFHDNIFYSSSNAAESSAASEEKEYSLSEGEIPSKNYTYMHSLHLPHISHADGNMTSSKKDKVKSFQSSNCAKRHMQLSPGEVTTFSQNYLLSQTVSAKSVRQPAKHNDSNFTSTYDSENHTSCGEICSQISKMHTTHSDTSILEENFKQQFDSCSSLNSFRSKYFDNKLGEGHTTPEDLRQLSLSKYDSLSPFKCDSETLDHTSNILQSTPKESLD